MPDLVAEICNSPGEMRNEYESLVRKLERKREPGIPSRGLEDNI
jgi:hypothetical protein